ncbi:MAG: DUF4832 domain-containing protein [Paludibacteraceae bacterium]|nr:DUF4832 domain-containing protein [Paludibacteraceae bacterium]
MKRIIGLLLIAVVSSQLSALGNQSTTVIYTPDNTSVFKNPERGFTEELNGKVSVNNPYRIKNHIDSNWGNKDCMTLPVVLYNFGNFKAQDLPDAILNGFDEDMQVLRDMGLKCVLRFAYTERESDIVDATPEWVKRHLEQLKPHLAANADVIYVLEAGFVGVWGEWYYSQNYGNETQHVTANRRKVIQYLFENVPEDRFILFRYPMIQQEYLNDKTPLSASEGFSGSEKARMGCHNDAFLHDWGNMGTYASDNSGDDPKMREYVAAHCLYTPNGGETNIDDDDALAEKRYSQAPEEMSRYHWSFCGSTYAMPVIRRWRSSGLFDTLNIHMGYRYQLIDARFSQAAAPAGKANISLRIRNAGYAPIYNERTAYVVLKDVSGKHPELRIPLKSDPRRWLPNNVITSVHEQVEIPADMPEGVYHLWLHMPDKYASIAADPRYAVRFANKDVWDAKTGMNDLGAEITVSHEAPLDPGPLPEGIDEVEPRNAQAGSTKVLEDGLVYIRTAEGQIFDVTGKKH